MLLANQTTVVYTKSESCYYSYRDFWISFLEFVVVLHQFKFIRLIFRSDLSRLYQLLWIIIVWWLKLSPFDYSRKLLYEIYLVSCSENKLSQNVINDLLMIKAVFFNNLRELRVGKRHVVTVMWKVSEPVDKHESFFFSQLFTILHNQIGFKFVWFK